MATTFALLLLSTAIIASMAGVLGFGIILVVSLSKCIRSKIWSPYDMIMISLSLSSVILLSWTILDSLISVYCSSSYYEENVFVVNRTVLIFLDYSGFWSCAWLSVFYCAKVASFTQSFFIWLKQRIASLVPWLLITSLLFSFTTALPLTWGIYGMHNNFTAPLTTANSSETGVTRKDTVILLILLSNAGIGFPLILSVVSSILLIRSLWIHTRQMQSNASGYRDPSLEAHMSAIKSVCSFLMLYITYFICLLLLISGNFLPLSIGESMCAVVMTACSAGHSMALIWSNPKFREVPARILHHANCHIRTRSW
ncbi:taste receptor type 2 member 40-like [Neopelma chrysocephalum]|uniref:taste receptor type 2 member 40-like n=1 Tax=Neopelma chrysocephalum TaxID=114329 RepID=UPI000FCD45EE|nr:taste receptor type 2 member 40-like [Neopelma chrysocephalum]